jgi:hypothetical protein
LTASVSRPAGQGTESLGDPRLVWEAALTVPQDDPYFFDHPLDHVPGMLMVEHLLGLVAHANGHSGVAPNCGRLELNFGRFCELDQPAVMRASEPLTPGEWQLEILQGGEAVCTGVATCAVRHTEPNATELPTATPVDAKVVHRSRPENVLIGDLGGHDGIFTAELINPPAGHYLTRRGENDRSLGEVIEAVRQFGTLLGHQQGVPHGAQMILTCMEVQLDRPVSRTERIWLRAAEVPALATKMAPVYSIHAGDDQEIGHASVAAHVFEPQAYRNLRQRAVSS